MAKVRTNNGAQRPINPEDYESVREIVGGGKKAPKLGAAGYEESLKERNANLKAFQEKNALKREEELRAKKEELYNKTREAGGKSKAEESIINEEIHNKVRTGEPGTYGSPVKKKIVYKK